MKFMNCILKNPEVCEATLEDKAFFLSCIRENIKNKHIQNASEKQYEAIYNAYLLKKRVGISETEMADVAIFCLRIRSENIGICMVYQFPDYIDFMYMHILEKYRGKGFATRFQILLEMLVAPGSRLRIRCYQTSPKGCRIACKLGYKIVETSNSGRKTFEKINDTNAHYFLRNGIVYR